MARAPHVRRRQHLGFAYRFVVFILWPLMRFVVSWEMTGTEKLTEADGGIIVAPNHTSWFDPPVVAFALWEADRPPRFLGKEAVFRTPVLGPLITHAGQIPVYRESTEAGAAIRDALTALDFGMRDFEDALQLAVVVDVLAGREAGVEPGDVRQHTEARLGALRVGHGINVVDEDSSGIRAHEPGQHPPAPGGPLRGELDRRPEVLDLEVLDIAVLTPPARITEAMDTRLLSAFLLTGAADQMRNEFGLPQRVR